MFNRNLVGACAFVFMVLTGCGSGGGSSSTSGTTTGTGTTGTIAVAATGGVPGPNVASVVVTPAQSTTTTGGNVAFVAKAYDKQGNVLSGYSFTWTASGGTISSSGVFTAGSNAGTFGVTATTASVTGNASVTVSAPPVTTPVLASITVTPASASTTTGGSVTFQATAKDTNGNTMTGLTFTWTATGGTITSTGVYTAGSTAGTFAVTATSGTVKGTASVTVSAPTPVLASITVTPASASTTTGGSVTFQATAKDTNGNTMTGVTVTWTATGGTISSSGVFTAGSNAGTFGVTATTSSVTGNASVTVSAPPVTTPVLGSITVTPASASTTTGGSVTFQATAKDTNGNTMTGVTVTWTATGGTITSTGVYTAGSTAGTFAVTATSGTVSGTASVTVSASTTSSTDPSWYTAPSVVGATRIVSISPGASLQTAFNNLQPGDILELSAGTYAAPNYPGIEKSGTSSSWIVVRGAAGTRPIIDLQNSGELHIGGSYVLFENIEVVNGAGNNIHVTPASSSGQTNVILRKVYSHAMASGTGAALKVAGSWNSGGGAPLDGLYIESGEFSQSRDNACIDGVGVRHAVVRDCYIHDPVVINMRSPGIFFKGGSSNALIERNLIRGIRGNGAVMVGGDTGANYFDILYTNPKIEAVNQVIRDNLLADFDDSAFEVRGCKGAKIYHNTVVAQTSFVIFRLKWGGSGSGTQIGNYDIDMTNNIILCYGTPSYAVNGGNTDATLTFGPQLWGGSLSQGSGSGIPTFPQSRDVLVGSGSFGAVLSNPSYTSITGLPDALQRFRLATSSPAKGKGAANTVVPRDIAGTARSSTAPSLGAYE